MCHFFLKCLKNTMVAREQKSKEILLWHLAMCLKHSTCLVSPSRGFLFFKKGSYQRDKATSHWGKNKTPHNSSSILRLKAGFVLDEAKEDIFWRTKRNANFMAISYKYTKIMKRPRLLFKDGVSIMMILLMNSFHVFYR